MALGSRIRLGAGLGALALLIIFVLQNLQDAEINFLFWSWDISVAFALLIAALLGGLVILGATWFGPLRRRSPGA
jgi:uncharacterized integral membrane protein